MEHLSNIPQKKIQDEFIRTLQSCNECKEKKLQQACSKCRIINTALQRYADSNIPVKYWYLHMDSSFKGDKVLLEWYEKFTLDLRETYKNGTSVCFAGTHGIGKTMTCTNILKKAVEKGYTSLYVTLNDIVTFLVSDMQNRAASRKSILSSDFLVIDEFDPRYIGSESAADLFGRVLEDIVRTRAQNCLPTITCTNSPKPVESFNGSLKTSIASLMNYFTMVTVIGKDMRKEGK